MHTAIKDYPSGQYKPLVDRIQVKYSCCGVSRGPLDWFSFDWYERNSDWAKDDVPHSCCSNVLDIPCIHLNLKNDSYYIKYNSSNPTIWPCGCTSKFKDIYQADFERLIYSGLILSFASICLTLADKIIQTADNTFCYKRKFRLGIFNDDSMWKNMIVRRKNKLLLQPYKDSSKPCATSFSMSSPNGSSQSCNSKRKSTYCTDIMNCIWNSKNKLCVSDQNSSSKKSRKKCVSITERVNRNREQLVMPLLLSLDGSDDDDICEQGDLTNSPSVRSFLSNTDDPSVISSSISNLKRKSSSSSDVFSEKRIKIHSQAS